MKTILSNLDKLLIKDVEVDTFKNRNPISFNGITYLKDNHQNVTKFDTYKLWMLNGKYNFSLNNGYFTKKFEGKFASLHFLLHGAPPKKLLTDHIDRNKTNNLCSNIRFVTLQQNSMNRKNVSGKYKGVSYSKRDNRYISKITVNGIGYNIGSFKNEKDSALAYDRYANYYFKNIAYLNFPDDKENLNIKVKNLVKKKKTSIYKGVCWDSYTKKWKVFYTLNCKSKHIGNCDSEEEAYKLRLRIGNGEER